MCRNTCICCEDWKCCKCRCCSRKNTKVVDKSSYDRRVAGQLFSQSPRAADRRQRNVNERGLTILEHHGKDHKNPNNEVLIQYLGDAHKLHVGNLNANVLSAPGFHYAVQQLIDNMYHIQTNIE